MIKAMKIIVSLVAILIMCGPALAEDYPTKPVSVIVPYGPGGNADITARMVAEKFKEFTGQSFLIVNKPGASGLLGLKYTLGQPPDGYTFLSGNLTETVSQPFFQNLEPLNLNNISFIGGYLDQTRLLYTTADKPYKTFAEFIAYAREHPGKITVGAASNVSVLVLKSVAVKEKLNLKYVIFKSGGEASTAILGGHVDVCETGTGTPAFNAVKEGKIRILANIGIGEVPYYENIPSLQGLGYPFSVISQYGMVAPKALPEELRQKLENYLKKVMADKEFAGVMLNMGLAPRFATGEEYKKTCETVADYIPKLINYIENQGK